MVTLISVARGFVAEALYLIKRKALTAIGWVEPRQAFLSFFARNARVLLVAMLTALYGASLLRYQQSATGLQIWVSGPEHWDYLFLSGVALLFLGLWLSLDINKRVDHTIDRLAERRALSKSGRSLHPGEVKSIAEELHESAGVWAYRTGTVLAVVLPIIFVAGLILSSRPTAYFLTQWVLIGFFGGYVVGYVLGRMSSYGVLSNSLQRRGFAFEMKPGHIDGAAGLKPFGDLFFFQAKLVAMPACFLSLWSLLIPVWTYSDYSRWASIYLGLLPIAILFVVLAFVLPMLSIHAIMKHKKLDFLSEADKLSQEVSEIKRLLEEPQSMVEREELNARIQAKTQRYHDLEKMPTWPVDSSTLQRFIGGNLALATPLVLDVIKQIVVGGISVEA